jgi:hypothetical protein
MIEWNSVRFSVTFGCGGHNCESEGCVHSRQKPEFRINLSLRTEINNRKFVKLAILETDSKQFTSELPVMMQSQSDSSLESSIF